MPLYRNKENGNIQNIPHSLADENIHELVEKEPCIGCKVTAKNTDKIKVSENKKGAENGDTVR